MQGFRNRRKTIIEADRLVARANLARELRPDTSGNVEAARLFQKAARLYGDASLGEAARLAWREAARCWAALRAKSLVERCERSANVIPEYWSYQKEDNR